MLCNGGYDDFLEGDDLYIVDDTESNIAIDEIKVDVVDAPTSEVSDLHAYDDHVPAGSELHMDDLEWSEVHVKVDTNADQPVGL